MRIMFVVVVLFLAGCTDDNFDEDKQEGVNDFMYYLMKEQACKSKSDKCKSDFDLAIRECKDTYSSDWNKYIANGGKNDEEYLEYLDRVSGCIVEHENIQAYIPMDS